MKKIILLSAFFYILAATFSEGFHHVDEHFQLLEFANYKSGYTSADLLPWEFREQMRPTLQPALAYSVQQGLFAIGDHNPFHLATLLRFLTAILSFITILLFARWAFSQIPENQRRVQNSYFALAFLLWYSIYLNVRFSSETWSGNFFILGFLAYHHQNFARQRFWQILTGCLFGLSFLFRYQTGFAIFGFGLWALFISRQSYITLICMATGLMMMFGVGILTDYWFYGDWVLSSWNYVVQNLVENKAAQFGVSPLWFYAAQTPIWMFPLFGVLIIPALVYFFWKYPRHPLTWSIIPFLLIHHAIGHKEFRFLFPLANLLPYILILCATQMSAPNSPAKRFFVGLFSKLFWTLNTIFLVLICLKPAHVEIPLYRYFYNEHTENVRVFYLNNENPFGAPLTFHLYQRPNFKFASLASPADYAKVEPEGVTSDFIVIKTTHVEQFQTELINKPLVYENFHPFFKAHNYYNWMEGVEAWSVFRLK